MGIPRCRSRLQWPSQVEMRACRGFREVEACCLCRFAELKQNKRVERVKRATRAKAGASWKAEKGRSLQGNTCVKQACLPPASPASRLQKHQLHSRSVGDLPIRRWSPPVGGWVPPRLGRFGVSHACRTHQGKPDHSGPLPLTRGSPAARSNREVHFRSHLMLLML